VVRVRVYLCDAQGASANSEDRQEIVDPAMSDAATAVRKAASSASRVFTCDFLCLWMVLMKKSSGYSKNALRDHAPPPVTQTSDSARLTLYIVQHSTSLLKPLRWGPYYFPMLGTLSQSWTVIVSKLRPRHRIGGGAFDVNTAVSSPNLPPCPTSRRFLTCRITRIAYF